MIPANCEISDFYLSYCKYVYSFWKAFEDFVLVIPAAPKLSQII